MQDVISLLERYHIWEIGLATLFLNYKLVFGFINDLLGKAFPALAERQKLRTASNNGERQRQHEERSDMLTILSVIVENEQAQQNRMQDDFNKRLDRWQAEFNRQQETWNKERQQALVQLVDLVEQTTRQGGDFISALMTVAQGQRETVNRLDRLCELLETRRIVMSNDPVVEHYGI